MAAYRLSTYFSRMKLPSSMEGPELLGLRKCGGRRASQYLLPFTLPMLRTNSICLGSQVSRLQERTCRGGQGGAGARKRDVTR